MRQSPLRTHAAPVRERRLKDAGLSGARALTRLLVALIESLGAHDKAGRQAGYGSANWPHGTTRSAFGPTPLGGEIERMMAGQPARPAPAQRHVGLEALLRQTSPDHASPERASPDRDPPDRDGAGEATARAAASTAMPAERPATPRVEASREVPRQPATPRPSSPRTPERPESLDAARMLRSAKVKAVSSAAPPATPPPDPLRAMPAWQQPFIAAPGVRTCGLPTIS